MVLLAKPSRTTQDQDPLEDEGPAAESSLSSGMESIRKFLSEKLNISAPEDDKIKILDPVSLDGIVDYIKAKDVKNIITLAGAGISTCELRTIDLTNTLPKSCFSCWHSGFSFAW